MNGADLFTYRGERRSDRQLIEILTERITIWNRPLDYLLSAAVAVAIGFAAAAGV